MNRLTLVGITLAVLAALTTADAPRARADEVPEKYRATINAGLQWLAEKQVISDDKREGHWAANGTQYPVAMTALAGMALLMEGSTIKDGKYAKHIERTTNWLMKKSQKGNQRDGLIGDTNEPNEAPRYMYGHGFGLLFLASVYGDEGNAKRRAELKDILTRAVKYTINSQSDKGGWYYTSKTEGGNNDEGSVTITQVQALRAARNAGIPVPRDVIVKAQKYLKDCTSPRGQVYYSFNQKMERPAITAAAVACGFNSGDYKDEFVKKWLKACQETIPPGLGMQQGGIRIGHDEYTHYYYAQCVYSLGDKGWDRLFPGEGGAKVTWTEYREKFFNDLVKAQNKDGSWTSHQGGFGVGPVYSTAIYCTIMQLDKGTLPIYQR
jgi:hypothetical protein